MSSRVVDSTEEFKSILKASDRPNVVSSIDSLRRLILMNRQQPPNLDREPGLLKNFTLGGFSQRLARLVSTTREQIRSFVILLVLQK